MVQRGSKKSEPSSPCCPPVNSLRIERLRPQVRDHPAPPLKVLIDPRTTKWGQTRERHSVTRGRRGQFRSAARATAMEEGYVLEKRDSNRGHRRSRGCACLGVGGSGWGLGVDGVGGCTRVVVGNRAACLDLAGLRPEFEGLAEVRSWITDRPQWLPRGGKGGSRLLNRPQRLAHEGRRRFSDRPRRKSLSFYRAEKLREQPLPGFSPDIPL
jgi:hypothetical protein